MKLGLTAYEVRKGMINSRSWLTHCRGNVTVNRITDLAAFPAIAASR